MVVVLVPEAAMKRNLLTIKDPGQGFLAGLLMLLISGLAAVIVAGDWLYGQGVRWAIANSGK